MPSILRVEESEGATRVLDSVARRYGRWISTWPLWLQPAGLTFIYTFLYGIFFAIWGVVGKAFGLHLNIPAVVLILLLGIQVASLFYGAAKSVLHLQTANAPFTLGALASLGFSSTMYVATCILRRTILPITLPGVAASLGALFFFGLFWKFSVAKPES